MEVTVKTRIQPQIKCVRCGFIWWQRDPEKIPLACANKKCRSVLWNKSRVYAMRKKSDKSHCQAPPPEHNKT